MEQGERYKITPDTEVNELPDGKVEVSLSDSDRAMITERGRKPATTSRHKRSNSSQLLKTGPKGLRGLTEEERRGINLDQGRGVNDLIDDASHRQPQDKGWGSRQKAIEHQQRATARRLKRRPPSEKAA